MDNKDTYLDFYQYQEQLNKARNNANLKNFNFGLYTEDSKPKSYSSQVLQGLIEDTPLSVAYFSPENIRIVQNMVRRDIYERTQGNYLIDYQPETEVLVVMRSVFLTYSKNLPTNVKEQITELNYLSYRKIVEKIYPNLVSYMIYLKDASQMYELNERPESASITGLGNKQLPGTDKFIFS